MNRDARAKPALALEGVSESFGDLRVLSDVTFSVAPGERIGIIGLNGAGKTTLFHVISGLEPRSNGRIALFGHNVTSAPPSRRAALGPRTFQITMLYRSLTVRENIDVALLGSTYRRWRFHFWAPLAAYRGLEARSRELLEAVGLWSYRDTEVRHRPTAISASLRSRSRSRPNRACCCSTNRPPVLRSRRSRACSGVLASLPPELTVVAVEHHLEFIFQFVRRVLVLHQEAC